MVALLFTVLLLVLMAQDRVWCWSFPFTPHLQQQFNRSFHERCAKYPFVEAYQRKLENPGDRFVVFVFQDARLNNGGLGDRYAPCCPSLPPAHRALYALSLS